MYCSKYLEDASFLKLDNLTLSYDVPLKEQKFREESVLFVDWPDTLCSHRCTQKELILERREVV